MRTNGLCEWSGGGKREPRRKARWPLLTGRAGSAREDTDGVVLSDAVLQYLQIGMNHFGEGRRQNYITVQVA